MHTGNTELSEWTTRERLLEAKGVADTLVTACSLCYDRFKSQILKEKIGMELYNLPLLVYEALE